MQLQEYCDILAKGERPYPFVNALRDSPVLCSEQYCKGTVFHGRIRRKDLELVRELAGQYHMELTVQKKRSVWGKLRRYRLRVGILAGLLLGAGLIFYQSNIVENIEIQGNQNVSGNIILSLLEEEGVRRGSWIPEIDMLRCEYILRSHVPELAWVGIRHTGNRLVVEVTETTKKPAMQQERTPSNIISLYDAQITDVRVYSGHLQRLIGDGVSKGELLVSGMFQDAKGHTNWHHSYAEITGIYQKEAELTENFRLTETVLTGRSVEQKWLRLFGLYIPLSMKKPEFSEFSVTEQETDFSFLEHTLPCGICQRRTEETSTTIIVRTEAETMQALQADTDRYEANFLQDVTVLDREVQYTSDENGITCHMTYRVEGEIGMQSEFFVK